MEATHASTFYDVASVEHMRGGMVTQDEMQPSCALSKLFRMHARHSEVLMYEV